ncbi:hypothetical protein EXIGLDRAFT_498163 [Exidia glandulosa HHB12029]|uniref:Uncharacterized protein n=1 Tax=Exidia glandulosa HHB12029 TaxID=1314781 RepID=A0A166N8X1_EXIGL|nr:hypothetical protein EXIGLDRAFT_498163 [Exidia glandulosa HHB12029]
MPADEEREAEVRGVDPARDYDYLSEFDAGSDFPLAIQLLDEAYALKRQGELNTAKKLMLVARAYLDVKCEMDEEAAHTAVNYRSYLLLGNLYHDMREWDKELQAYTKASWTWDMLQQRNKFIPSPIVYYSNLQRCNRELEDAAARRCRRRLSMVLLWLRVVSLVGWAFVYVYDVLWPTLGYTGLYQ